LSKISQEATTKVKCDHISTDLNTAALSGLQEKHTQIYIKLKKKTKFKK